MVKILVLLTVLSMKIVSIQSEQFGLFPGILGEPRRLHWHPYFEPQLNVMMQINKQMLTTYVLITSFPETLNFQFFEVFSQTWLFKYIFVYFNSYMKMHLDHIKTNGKFRREKIKFRRFRIRENM